MNVNTTITMVVGLVVGVLLIAGVVAPVIANVSSDSGDSGTGIETDITGYDRYAKVTGSTDVTIYPYYDEDTGNYAYSYTDPSEPDAQIIPLYGNAFIMGDGWIAHMEGGSSWLISWQGEIYDVVPHITYNSTVATGYIWGTNTQVTLDLPVAIFYPSPDGEYVDPFRYDEASNQDIDLPYYANSNTEICCEISMEGDGGLILWDMYIVGTISDNSAWMDIDEEGGLTYSDTATFTIEDGVATAVSVTVDGNTYDVPLQSGDDSEDYDGYLLVLPVSVYEGGGSGGSGLSPTLTTILSVIPLVLTVGLVLGAVAFIKMKN